MTDEQPPNAPQDQPQPPYEPPPPPSHGPFAFPPPPEANLPRSSWGPSPDQPQQPIGWPTPRAFYPLDFGRVWQLAWSLYRFKWRTFAALGLVSGVPTAALVALANYYQLSSPDFISRLNGISAGTGFDQFSTIESNLPLSLGYGLLVGLVSIMATGAIAYAAGQAFSGSPVSTVSAVGQSLRKLVTWIGISVVIFLSETVLIAVVFIASRAMFGSGPATPGLLTFLGLIVFVALGALVLFLTVRWSFASQAVMLESAGSLMALRRSWHLAAGSAWRVLGYILGFGIVVGLIAAVIGFFAFFVFNPISFTGARLSFDAGRLALGTFFSSVLASALIPIPTIALTLLYFDLCFRKGEQAPLPGGTNTSLAR
jgi:hypothetical protein